MKTSWRDVPGTLRVDVRLRPDAPPSLIVEYGDEESPKHLAPALAALFPANAEPAAELYVRFTSTGWSDPGNWGSLPEDYEPGDGEDVRELDLMTLELWVWADAGRSDGEAVYVPVPKELAAELFDDLYDLVDQAETDYKPEPEPPDYDDY